MLPPELMGAPQGAPQEVPDFPPGSPPPIGAPPGDMGGMPPELMGGGGPPPLPPEAMGAPPPEEPPSPETGRASDILKGILGLAQQYQDQENSQQNILLIEQLRTLCQKILAEEEKEAHNLMQGKVTPKAILTHG